jgi:hypothetical protein
MALVGNGVRLATSNPMRQMGAPQGGVVERSQWSMGGAERNRHAGMATVANVTQTYGIPSGYTHPAAWSLPQKAGGLASRFEVAGEASFSGAGALGKNAEASLSGSAALSALGQLIVSAVAALTGSGGVTSANLQAILNALASLSGSGTAAVSMTAKGHLSGTLTGVGTATVTPYATGELAADITVAAVSEQLSPAEIAAAVWDSIRTSSAASGSMGEALVELFKLAGLDPSEPLVVTSTTRKVPADGSTISQTIAEGTGGTVTVTRL